MPDNLPAVPELPPERVQEYQAAAQVEFTYGRAYLLAIWDTGHALRAHNDPPKLIAQAISRSPAWVYDRIQLAGDYTRRELADLIDRESLVTKGQLFRIAYGRGVTPPATRRGIHIPLPLLEQADAVQVDIVELLKQFLATVSLPELRAILRRFGTERDERGRGRDNDTHRV